MKFLIISDMHGDTKHINQLEKQFKEADAVLFAGDFAEFGKPETGKPALDLLCKKHDTIYAVLGNCDSPDFISELEKKDINIQGQLAFFEGLMFLGSGGGSKFTGTTPYEREDKDLVCDLECVKPALDKGKASNLILVCHNPIFNTTTDKVSDTVHVGSPLLKKFIEDYEPLLVVCGHIHESPGIDKIGSTTIINPGPLLQGHYATATVQKLKGEWAVTECKLF